MLGIFALTLLGIVAALLVGVLSVFCTPVAVNAQVDSESELWFKFGVALFGGLAPVFTTSDEPSTKIDAEPELGPDEDSKEDKPLRPKKSSRFGITAYAPHMLQEAPRFLSTIMARVKFKTVNADVEFGCPDPADTGVVYGVLTPIALLANTRKSSCVTLQPDFSQASFRFRGFLAARFTPIALLVPAFGFGWAVFVAPRLTRALR